MNLLTEQDIIARITRGQTFEAMVDTGAFTIRIREYVPAVFTAIHDGHEVGRSVADKMLVSNLERKFEEDPYTGDIINSFSISIRLNHSRYYYDLNRRPEQCIYHEAWGKKVWGEPLSAAQGKEIRGYHDSYYRVMGFLVCTLEKRFGRCVIYDLHSYNFSRINGNPPLFNIGTHYINRQKYEPVLRHLAEQLGNIGVQDYENRAVFDEVFEGMGYQAEFIHTHYPENLCIPLEIKKVFMDEKSCALISKVSESLFDGMQQALGRNATYFSETMTE